MPPNRQHPLHHHPTLQPPYPMMEDEDGTPPLGEIRTTGSMNPSAGLTVTTDNEPNPGGVNNDGVQQQQQKVLHVRRNSRGGEGGGNPMNNNHRRSHRPSRRHHGRSNSDIPESVQAMPPTMRHPLNGAPPAPPPRYPMYGSMMAAAGTTGPIIMQGSNLPYHTAEGGISTPPRPRSGSFSERNSRKKRNHHHHHRKSRSSSDPIGHNPAFFSPQAEWRQLSSRSIVTNVHRRSESNGSFDGSIGEAIFTSSRYTPNTENPLFGVEQPLTCRNVFFLLLFVFHLILVFYAGQHYFRKAVQGGVVIGILYDNLIKVAAYSGMFAVILSMMLLLIVSCASQFIQTALFLTISMSFLWGTIGIGISPHSAVPITGMIGFALSIAYAFIVWDRIPLSAANLRTGIAGLRRFWSICCVAIFVQWMAWAYVVYYSVVVCGVYDWIHEKRAAEHGGLEASPDGTDTWKDFKMTTSMARTIYVLLAISFFWTLQVMQGTVQAITAAIVRGWWFRPKDNGIVSRAVFTTVFYSLGSICFGSLFVGPIRILRMISVLFRPSALETSSLMVMHECVHFVQSCMANCVDRLSASINSWSYTYIGMFHYGFLEAGYKATEVFAARGWTTIVSDDLVSNVFFLTSLMIGGLTGCFAYLLSNIEDLRVMPTVDEPGLATFVVGVVVGLVLPSIVFSVIISAVDAVLVCFASSPIVLEENHPELSHQMRAAWREVWPGALDDPLFAARAGHVRRRSSGRTASLSPLHASLRSPANSIFSASNGMPPDMHPLLI